MKIYKEDVIEALYTEPLGWNGWFAVDDFNSDCSVCAVGAVLRNRGVNGYKISGIAITLVRGAYAPDDNKKHLPKNWISALSYVWESLIIGETIPVEEARSCIIEWAEKNLPEDIDLVGEIG